LVSSPAHGEDSQSSGTLVYTRIIIGEQLFQAFIRAAEDNHVLKFKILEIELSSSLSFQYGERGFPGLLIKVSEFPFQVEFGESLIPPPDEVLDTILSEGVAGLPELFVQKRDHQSRRWLISSIPRP